MLNNEKLIHRLTLEQKLKLIISSKEYEREQIDDYEFPIFNLLAEPYKGCGDSKSTVFPPRNSLARTWDIDLIKNVYEVLGLENDRLSNEMFFLLGCKNDSSFIDDQFFLGQFNKAASLGLDNSKSLVCLANETESDNFGLNMLASDISLQDKNNSYILVNNIDQVKYYRDLNHYNGVFLGKTMFKEMVIQFLINGVSMIYYSGDFNELTEYLTFAVNEYNKYHIQYNNKEITLAEFNGLIEQGKIISQELIDKACDSIIDLFIKITQFRDKATLNRFTKKSLTLAEVDKNRELALDVARKSIVILKNNNHILPFNFHNKVAIIGEAFKNQEYLEEMYHVENEYLKTGFDLISNYEEISYIGYAHGYVLDAEPNNQLINEAMKLAKDADNILIYLQAVKGEDKLRDNQLNLLKELKTLDKPIIAVVLSDRYIDLEFEEYCSAIVYCDELGLDTHQAILDVITDKVHPTGRLTSNYPLLVSDATVSDNDLPGYATEEPIRYPFGHGLDYGTYEFTNLDVKENELTFIVKNISDFDGYIIPQLYVCKEDSKTELKNKLLKGFKKVFILKGETVKISIPFDENTFKYFDKENNTYGIEGGNYQIMVGLSALDIKLKGELTLAKYSNRAKYSENELLDNNLNQVDMVEFMNYTKKPSNVKSVTIISILILAYINISLILIVASADFEYDKELIFVSIFAVIALIVDVLVIKKLVKVLKNKKSNYNYDPNKTLTEIIDKVEVFNPVVNYCVDKQTLDKEVNENKDEPADEFKTLEVKEKEAEVNNNEEESNESSEDLLEKVEVEQQEEVAESIYDENASLSLDEIEKFEEEEMKILEEQQNNNQSGFDDVQEEIINFDTESSVAQVINNFIDYAKHFGLNLEINSVRSLFGALAASKMIFITTNIQEQTDKLLEILNSYFAGKSTIINAEDNWASLFSISWIKNEAGVYEKSLFIQDMYKAGLLKNNLNLEIIKNVSLSNFELYFKKCIDASINPTRNYALDISKQIKVYIPHNLRFIIAPRDYNYLSDVTPNLVEGAVFIEVVIHNTCPETPLEGEQTYISENYFGQLIHDSLKNNYLSEASWKKIDEFIEEINKEEYVELSNKDVLAIERYAAIFKDSGGDEIDLIDSILAYKIIPLIKTLKFVKEDEGYKLVKDLIERIFGQGSIKKAINSLDRRSSSLDKKDVKEKTLNKEETKVEESKEEVVVDLNEEKNEEQEPNNEKIEEEQKESEEVNE